MKYSYCFLMFFFVILTSCNKEDDSSDCSVTYDPVNTRFFEFLHTSTGATFIAWTSDQAVLDDVLDQLSLPQADRNKHINGGIAELPDGCNLNKDWSWYFPEDDWAMAELSIELCDGNPQFVEENLQEYVRTGRYCPWGSIVLKEVDAPF